MEHSNILQSILFQKSIQISMNSFSFTSKASRNLSGSWEGTVPMSAQQQDILIEMYLNEQVFYHRSSQRTEESNITQFKSESKTENSPPSSEECQPLSAPAEERKKSIFHNFQKHLITIIKKYMSLSKNKLIESQNGPLALLLWQAFMKTNSFNKKLLHTVFGVQATLTSSEILTNLSLDFPQFSHIGKQVSQGSIQSAQGLIRASVVEQAGHLSKFFLKSNSNITKFDEFYGYYCNFIRQISSGPLSKRMTKTSKQTLMDTIKPKRAA